MPASQGGRRGCEPGRPFSFKGLRVTVTPLEFQPRSGMSSALNSVGRHIRDLVAVDFFDYQCDEGADLSANFSASLAGSGREVETRGPPRPFMISGAGQRYCVR